VDCAESTVWCWNAPTTEGTDMVWKTVRVMDSKEELLYQFDISQKQLEVGKEFGLSEEELVKVMIRIKDEELGV